ncbi:Brp/Blh family beta-carotene 15,15'-dioxygenase [uncultured Tenacibaculum sp.]|uniref:Brp/Blh family beta-carotene 15,15'-dioxygenase n=1 Tax=uncultured Tenacibaculum sp. TaxID=174713 RepID=UPI00263032EB|nr:Brp/Blh family beta-carotene 15,15'-dioxygenase [uncultured Tenacibaculum sp.]
MADYKNITIFSTFLSLWIAVFFNYDIENFLAYVLILSFGVLHGANDLKLIEKKHVDFNRKLFLKVLFTYLLIILGITSIFFFFPLFALSLFILLSSYHFGEEHLSSKLKKSSVLTTISYTIHGLLVFSILFFSNSQSTSVIINDITGFYPNEEIFKYALYTLLILMSITFIICSKIKLIKIIDIVEECFYLLILYVIFKTASLLWSFAIYFVFWHSIPSLVRQVRYLYGNNKRASFKAYLKSSFIYWILSLIGLGILYLIFSENETVFTPILFIMLATITFPHVWIISRLDKDY